MSWSVLKHNIAPVLIYFYNMIISEIVRHLVGSIRYYMLLKLNKDYHSPPFPEWGFMLKGRSFIRPLISCFKALM